MIKSAFFIPEKQMATFRPHIIVPVSHAIMSSMQYYPEDIIAYVHRAVFA